VFLFTETVYIEKLLVGTQGNSVNGFGEKCGPKFGPQTNVYEQLLQKQISKAKKYRQVNNVFFCLGDLCC